jgi:ABC-type nitrate/sulfonate/bicarbonate transport system substrate-binding protein
MYEKRLRLRGFKQLLVVGTTLTLAVGLLSGCAGAAAPEPSASANADGTPDLTGQSITIAVGAAPDTTDTKIYLMTQILHDWGATTKIVNQTGDPAAIRVVLAGQADVGAVAVTSAINSGLTIFGPAQPRLDYHFVGSKDLTSISDLPGKVYGTSNPHGLEALMFASMLDLKKIDPASVTVTQAGGASVRVSAMLAGQIQATFVHSQDLKTLTDAGFNDLATMSELTPQLADSFMGTTSAWYKDHPALAAAVDEAWIKAAQIFNDDETQWVKAAIAYGGGTEADAKSLYDALKSTDTFPATKDAFSAESAQYQEKQALSVQAITSSPDLSTWFDTKAWDTATSALKIK